MKFKKIRTLLRIDVLNFHMILFNFFFEGLLFIGKLKFIFEIKF